MRLENSVVIKRPIAEVWAFVLDPFNFPRLGTTAGLQLRWNPPGPLGLGSTYRIRIVLLGSEREATGAITEWDPPHALTMSMMVGGLGSAFIRHTQEETAEGTKVVMSVMKSQLGLVMKLLWPLLGPFLRRQMDARNKNIKRLLEGGGG